MVVMFFFLTSPTSLVHVNDFFSPFFWEELKYCYIQISVELTFARALLGFPFCQLAFE